MPQKEKQESIVVLGRPRAFDTEQALEQAMKVFWRLGYEGASLSALTKAMGINSPSLYAAFGSKEGLFKAVLDHYEARRRRCMDQIMCEPTARGTAERLLYGLVDLVTDPEEPPGCLFLQGGLSCGSDTQDIPQELARRRASLEQTLTQRFTGAMQAGDLPPDANPSALASYLCVVCNGIAIQAGSGSSREDLRRVAELALHAWPVGGGHGTARPALEAQVVGTSA
jgi:AcrR family transcriptional regulator